MHSEKKLVPMILLTAMATVLIAVFVLLSPPSNAMQGSGFGGTAAAIASTGLSDSANLARLNAAQTFTAFPQVVGALTTTDTAAQVSIGQQTGKKCLVVQHKQGDTTNIQEWQEFNGGLFGYIDFNGAPNFTQGIHAGGLYTTNSTAILREGDGLFLIDAGAKINVIRGVNTAGWAGVPAIYGSGRTESATALVASVATYTCGAADGSFIVSANVNITAFAVGTFNVNCVYTDETNTSQTLKLNFSSVTGTIGIALAAAGPFEGIPARIRCKASTAITITTSGTFTSLTYNVEGDIQQVK